MSEAAIRKGDTMTHVPHEKNFEFHQIYFEVASYHKKEKQHQIGKLRTENSYSQRALHRV